MSEQDRIKEIMAKAIHESDSVGVLVESSHYRATGPTRTMVHTVARAWGMKALTRLEKIGDKFYLWFRVVEL